MGSARSLSKDQVLTGLRCHKYLWWLANEPGAPELKPDSVLLDRFDQGREVGKLARTYVPGGELIGTPFISVAERAELTRRALEQGASVLYEAAFEAAGVAVLVDILERGSEGFSLIEVKSSTAVKKKHIPEVGLQVHVARQAGVAVRCAELMHLNPDCRHPDLSNLFVREDVTADASVLLPIFPAAVPGELEVIRGSVPDVPIGDQCTTPDDCPFMARCWQPLRQYHVTTLHNVRKKKLAALAEMGIATIGEIPDDFDLNEISARQRQAIREGRIVVDPSLGQALAQMREPIAFLDFETVSRAIPIWEGCRPWEHVAAQLSCHVRDREGAVKHYEWLTEGAGDPRREAAANVVEACRGASVVVAYYASFERDRILGLADAVPELRQELLTIAARLVDLWPVVRDHVYHPAFDGSFSLKAVAPALVPDLTYRDLAIASGGDATVQLARLALTTGLLEETERVSLRQQLVAYCERDTLCLVRLLDRLRELASRSTLASQQ